jgi:hypothetical protein
MTSQYVDYNHIIKLAFKQRTCTVGKSVVVTSKVSARMALLVLISMTIVMLGDWEMSRPDPAMLMAVPPLTLTNDQLRFNRTIIILFCRFT